MSDLLQKIKEAQRNAGEQVVIDSLKEKGFIGKDKSDNWISVNDCMPNDNEWVLVYGDCGVIIAIHCTECETGLGSKETGWLSTCDTQRIEGVTHWMPLPEKPL